MYRKPITNYRKSKQLSVSKVVWYKPKSKLQKYCYQCEVCLGYFDNKEIEINHIIPAWSLKSSSDVWWFIDRLFVEEWFECICKGCHILLSKKQKEWKKQ